VDADSSRPLVNGVRVERAPAGSAH
jgi:hypothetical protein